jgi:enterochelin esterase-like enzyme
MQAQYRRAFGAPEDPARLRFDLFQRLKELEPRAPRNWPFIHLACGSEDLFLSGSQKLAEELETLGLPHTLRVGRGGHDLAYWEPELKAALASFDRWRTSPAQ